MGSIWVDLGRALRAGAREEAVRPEARPRVLVGGFGQPWHRDLDFGSRFVCCAEALDWPDGVTVEDLSFSAVHVVHRLQELRPAKVVIVAGVARGSDPAGTVRRYRIEPEPTPSGEVHEHLLDAVGGAVDLDEALAVARHWAALPPVSVRIEVEPGDTSFGLGLSEDVAASIDTVLAAVRDELGSAPPPAATTVSDKHISQLLAR